jgi:type II secretory pathway pseudopilin PulG
MPDNIAVHRCAFTELVRQPSAHIGIPALLTSANGTTAKATLHARHRTWSINSWPNSSGRKQHQCISGPFADSQRTKPIHAHQTLPVVFPAPTGRPLPHVGGMTLMELSLAVVVLTVGMLTALGQISSLRGARIAAQEAVAVHAVVSALAERIQGARWDTLGATTAPWSINRTEPNAGVGTVTKPLVDDSDISAFDENDDGTLTESEIDSGRLSRGLQTLGIISEPTTVADLRVYVEYYRAVTMRDGDGNPISTAPGMMSGQDITYDSIDEFTRRFRFNLRQEDLPAAERSTILAHRATYRLDTTQSPIGLVGENEPIIVRILATWSTRMGGLLVPSGQLNVITSRRP